MKTKLRYNKAYGVYYLLVIERTGEDDTCIAVVKGGNDLRICVAKDEGEWAWGYDKDFTNEKVLGPLAQALRHKANGGLWVHLVLALLDHEGARPHTLKLIY